MAGIIVWESEAGIIVWESDGRYYCVRVWWPVLMCESLITGISVRQSDGWY